MHFSAKLFAQVNLSRDLKTESDTNSLSKANTPLNKPILADMHEKKLQTVLVGAKIDSTKMLIMKTQKMTLIKM